MSINKRISLDQARIKIFRFCAYQERCHQEVKAKLYAFGLFTSDVDLLIVELIDQNFLNESRFAASFASGKFRMKKWGRKKIEFALKQKAISDWCIKKALQELDPDEYHQTLTYLIETQRKKLLGLSEYEIKGKVAAYLINKGFESDLVYSLIQRKE